MEQALQQVLFIPELMSAAEFGRLENARRCGVRHHAVEAVQYQGPDSIAIVKKELAGRMCGAVDLAVDAGWKYFEVLKQALRTGHGGGELKQREVGGQYMPSAGARGQEWLQGVGRFKAFLGEWWPLRLPEPNGPPGANFGPTADCKSIVLNAGMSDV